MQLLSDSKGAMEFPRTNTILHVGLIQIARSHLSRPSGESSMMVPTFTENWALGCRVLHCQSATRSDIAYVLRATGRADHAILPAAVRHEVRNAVVRVGKVNDRVLKGLGFGCHEPILRQVA